MTRRLSPEDQQAVQQALSKKPSKYRANPVVTHEGRFDSTGEYDRWCELKLLQRAGKIRHLARQVGWPLDVNGQNLGRYVCDYKYFDVTTCEWIVEDFKGFSTPLYKWKKAHMEAQHGITILETKAR